MGPSVCSKGIEEGLFAATVKSHPSATPFCVQGLIVSLCNARGHGGGTGNDRCDKCRRPQVLCEWVFQCFLLGCISHGLFWASYSFSANFRAFSIS
jgi:hypothetical protein